MVFNMLIIEMAFGLLYIIILKFELAKRPCRCMLYAAWAFGTYRKPSGLISFFSYRFLTVFQKLHDFS